MRIAYKEYRDLKVYKQSGYKYKATPAILLKGQWLKELGFEAHIPITVRCLDGELVITLSDEIVID